MTQPETKAVTLWPIQLARSAAGDGATVQALPERHDPRPGGPESLTVEVTRETDRTLIQLTGELDIDTADILAGYFEDEPTEGTRLLVVDMSGIRFCGAAGIQQLLTLQERLDQANVELRLVIRTPGVRRAFDALGLTRYFRVLDDRTAA
jgi:anti-anti-sigma factor